MASGVDSINADASSREALILTTLLVSCVDGRLRETLHELLRHLLDIWLRLTRDRPGRGLGLPRDNGSGSYVTPPASVPYGSQRYRRTRSRYCR